MNADALAAMVSHQMQGVSKAWSALLGLDVTFGAPRLEPLPAGGLASVHLPWPMAVTKVVVEGGAGGFLLVLIEVVDAVTVCAPIVGKLPKEGRGSGALDAGTEGALRELFGLFAGWTGQALQKATKRTVHARHAFTREAADATGKDTAGLPPDCWVAHVRLSVGRRPLRLWEVIPAEVGMAVAEQRPAAGAADLSGGTTIRRRKGSRGRVLVVDDVAAIRSIIKWVLEKDGYTVQEAEEGTAALALVEREKPDVVLLDVMMPDMDGFEVCRRLRQLPGGQDVPVIMCTCNDRQKDVLQAIQAGATDYIVKPFAHATLLEKIRKARGKGGGGARGPGETPAGPAVGGGSGKT